MDFVLIIVIILFLYSKNLIKKNYNIDSKIILFSNLSFNVKEKLNNILNYYHRKDVDVKINPYFSPFIKIMYIGVTGTGKSTIINEFNEEKISYSSSENQMKTRLKQNRKLLFKNKKYPILNQDTEGFEIGDISQIEKVNDNINKNEGHNFEERLHIVIYLVKNERGLDDNDIPLLIKLHNMKILYYVLWPRSEGKDQILKGKANRLINSLISKLKNNDDSVNKLFNEFKDKTILSKILKQIAERLKERIFSADILSKDSIGKFNLFDKIKKDLLEIYEIHEKFIKTIENHEYKKVKLKISISGKILEKEEHNYIQILDNSPFFYKFSIDDIKRQEAEKLLKNCDVSSAWLIFYNKRVESFRKSILAKIKNIYSDVKIDTEVDENKFSNEESWFYNTETTKEFIEKLINFFAEKYKGLELNKKYYSSCKEYNKSIKEFEKYVEEFKNLKLNKESVRYDIDFI